MFVLPLAHHGACLIASLGILFLYYQLHQIPDELVILFSYPHHSLLCFANADVNLKLVRRFDLNWFELETSTKIFDFDLKHINLSNWWVNHNFNPFGFFLKWMYVQFLKKMLRMYKKSQHQYLVMLCKWCCLLWQPLQDILLIFQCLASLYFTVCKVTNDVCLYMFDRFFYCGTQLLFFHSGAFETQSFLN